MAINAIKDLGPALGAIYTHLITICKVLSRANAGAVAPSDQVRSVVVSRYGHTTARRRRVVETTLRDDGEANGMRFQEV
ncbi:hypothetical protein L195_g025892 [Trifolium pratense]|uniref:Uncharacterized protein n=1 Tax=Trifolium pratense TaxID=57577 RepID=A0A2K3NHT2_TRIPR|nr:hypothetical protein L195_g025892 [Trifolium pratense]